MKFSLLLVLAIFCFLNEAAFAQSPARSNDSLSNEESKVREPRPELPLAESLPQEAKVEYEAALLLFKDGDYAGASTKFNRAYELSNDARLLWNRAVCEKEQRRYARAASLVERYLELGGDAIAPDKRAAAFEIAQSLRAFYSPVYLRGVPEGALVAIDGEIIDGPFDKPTRLDLGTHRLRVEAPGFQKLERMIEVPGATRVEVAVRLERDVVLSGLSVAVHESPGTIRIDGTVVGEGRWNGALPPGRHVLTVSAPGKKKREIVLQLVAGGHRSIEITLESDRSTPVWPFVLGGAAAAVGGVVLGAVLASQSTTIQGPVGSLGSIDASPR